MDPHFHQRHFFRFAGCPAVDVSTLTSVDAFWQLMRREPAPRKLVSGNSKAVSHELIVRLLGKHSRWNLSSTMVTAIDGNPSLWRRLQEDTPMPIYAQPVDLYPMISFGQEGTGEVRLAHHRHGTTAMHLLVGEKVWAFKPPGDPQCRREAPDCPLPFDVCAHHRGRSPLPCVQRAGETVIFPDGWHHGTCNTAPWTVGWGGQGLRVRFEPGPCDLRRNASWCEGHSLSHAFAPVGVPMARTRELAVAVWRGLSVPLNLAKDLQRYPWAVAAFHSIQSALRSFVFAMMPAASRRLFMEACPDLDCADEVVCHVVGVEAGADLTTSTTSLWSTGTMGDGPAVFLHLDLARAKQPAPSAAGGAMGLGQAWVGSRLHFRSAAAERTLRYGEAVMWVGGELTHLVASSGGAADERPLVLTCRAPLPASAEASWQWRDASSPEYRTSTSRVPATASGVREHAGIECRDPS